MSKKKITRVPIKNIVSEDGAHELATSPYMQPYLRLIKAGLQDKDTTPHVEKIAALPLERRYIWRVASALKWAFADLETVSVALDRKTLSPKDLAKVIELLKLRPIQFCIFLKALLGGDGTPHGRSGYRCETGRLDAVTRYALLDGTIGEGAYVRRSKGEADAVQ